jgi:hypothetical protein
MFNPHVTITPHDFTWQKLSKYCYCSLGLVSTLTKWIIFFQKLYLFYSFEIIGFSIIYYNILIWVMKLFTLYHDNYDDFQHVNLTFSQNFVSLFGELFNDKTDLTIRYRYFFLTYFINILAWLPSSVPRYLLNNVEPT